MTTINEHLQRCRFRYPDESHADRRRHAEEAISLMRIDDTPIRIPINVRGLVYFPDLLEIALGVCIIDPLDIGCMMARCCELFKKRQVTSTYSDALDAIVFECSPHQKKDGPHDDWRIASIKVLLSYVDQHDAIKSQINLRVMWSVYEIDQSLISLLRQHQIEDVTMRTQSCYPYETDAGRILETCGYFGYRNAVHLLQCKETISVAAEYNRKPTACVLNAICDYLASQEIETCQFVYPFKWLESQRLDVS